MVPVLLRVERGLVFFAVALVEEVLVFLRRGLDSKADFKPGRFRADKGDAFLDDFFEEELFFPTERFVVAIVQSPYTRLRDLQSMGRP